MSIPTNFIISDNEMSADDVRMVLISRLSRFNEIVQNTYLHIDVNRNLLLMKMNEYKSCIIELKNVRKTINLIYNDIQNVMNAKIKKSFDQIVKQVQKLNMELSNILKKWGTRRFDDFLYICFGKDYLETLNTNKNTGKFPILDKQFHPLRYTIVSLEANKLSTISLKDTLQDFSLDQISKLQNFTCIDVSLPDSFLPLFYQTNGMVVYFKNEKMNAGMFVTGFLDNMDIELINSSYINDKYKTIISNIPPEIDSDMFKNFLQCINNKEWLVNGNIDDIYNYYIGGLTEMKALTHQSLISMSNDFLTKTLFVKRQMLLYLLLDEGDVHNKYLAYFLYDLLSMDSSVSIDGSEQTEILQSFTSKMNDLFNNSLVETIQYTGKLNKLDSTKVNLEQQICLMNVDDTVKEKAMVKLREVKAKSDDGGSKARYFLDGLLKIPFGIFVKEPIMESDKHIKSYFSSISNNDIVSEVITSQGFESKQFTTTDVKHLIRIIRTNICSSETVINQIIDFISKKDKKSLNSFIENINQGICEEMGDKMPDNEILSLNKKTKNATIECLKSYILQLDGHKKVCVVSKIISLINPSYGSVLGTIDKINRVYVSVNNYMKNVSKILDDSVYGHKNAKTQVLRIIGQWINGEQSGYCFGFEGPPGVGKTSLAKYGLSNCLQDENGKSRPFSMIAIGGDSNGSTLHGHNYTYVGSTWGSVVQILMDKNCMNPIIFIDELDKISRTEHGRELIGILTHMLDPTQNDKFQDKYFSGIDIDLSKVLFVLSYNDADLIDRILLDRIHRIKFTNLSLDEKIHIAQTYTLPDIYKKMGLSGAITIKDDVIRYIIDNYTMEPGVRKLKEKLFEIISDINLKLLTENNFEELDYPVDITIDDIKNVYFKDKHPVIIKMVPSESKIGYANGLWANSLGQGGTLPIEAFFYPTSEFLKLKLTGKQGDVMQESMNVALTLAYKLTPKKQCDKINKLYNGTSKYGIHIHTPEGATPKDGPSAGSCITTVLYSLINDKKIKSNCGVTGEIQLNGSITAIGGLDLKILGSLKSGVNTYFYPTENQRDFDKFYEKYKDKDELVGIKFFSVSTIEELIGHIIEK